jgi:hypothetical protein
MTLPTEDEHSLSVLSPTADAPIDSFRGVEAAARIPEHAEAEKATLSVRERREQIWSQMVELRMVAESIYKLTLETTESLPRRPRPLYR